MGQSIIYTAGLCGMGLDGDHGVTDPVTDPGDQ